MSKQLQIVGRNYEKSTPELQIVVSEATDKNKSWLKLSSRIFRGYPKYSQWVLSAVLIFFI